MFKAISSDDYIIRPFVTHKTQTYTYVSGGLNPPQIVVDFAQQPTASNPWNFVSSLEAQNPDGIYRSTLYRSVRQLFYTSASLLSGSIPSSSNSGTYGAQSGSLAMNWQAGGDLRRLYALSSSVWVMNFPQTAFGEGIRYQSFSLTSPSTTASILDDGFGRLYVGNTGSVVGNIFYKLGIAVLNPAPASSGTISSAGFTLAPGSQFNVQFDATQTIYEHYIIATINPFEFNFSSNVSSQATASNGETIPDLFLSGSMTPYVTTVGLYDQYYHLIAVAKLRQPVKRITEMPQSIIIRLDA